MHDTNVYAEASAVSWLAKYPRDLTGVSCDPLVVIQRSGSKDQILIRLYFYDTNDAVDVCLIEQVQARIKLLSLECPDYAVGNVRFDCFLRVGVGSPVTLSVDMDDGTVFPIPMPGNERKAHWWLVIDWLIICFYW